MDRARRLTLTLTAMLAAVLWTTMSAAAHDVLLESDPADGATLESSPTRIVLTFSNEPQPQYAQVVIADAEGTVVLDDEPAYDGTTVSLMLDDPLPPGEYSVEWRVVSSDAHPIEGALGFAVNGEAEALSGADVEATAPTGSASAVEEGSADESEAVARAETPAEERPTESASGLGQLPLGVRVLIIVVAAGSVGATVVLLLRRLRNGR